MEASGAHKGMEGSILLASKERAHTRHAMDQCHSATIPSKRKTARHSGM